MMFYFDIIITIIFITLIIVIIIVVILVVITAYNLPTMSDGPLHAPDCACRTKGLIEQFQCPQCNEMASLIEFKFPGAFFVREIVLYFKQQPPAKLHVDSIHNCIFASSLKS